MDAAGYCRSDNFVFNKKVKKGFKNGVIVFRYQSGIGIRKPPHSLALSYGDDKWINDFLYSYDYYHRLAERQSFQIATVWPEIPPTGRYRLKPLNLKALFPQIRIRKKFR